MTTNQTTPAPATTDPLPLLRRAADQLGDLVVTTSPGDLDRTTPCDDWRVRDLLAHVVAVGHRVAHIARGGHPFEVPSQVEGVADDGWAAAWLSAHAELLEAVAAPDLLDRQIQHPMGTFPARTALLTYTSELTAHGWDLAVATGRGAALDEELAAACVSPLRSFLPAEPRGGHLPFAPVVEVAEGAPAYDQLVGWYGRDPHWAVDPSRS